MSPSDRRRLGMGMAILLFLGSAGVALTAPRPPRRSLAVQDLGMLDGTSTQGTAINDLGQIVGVALAGNLWSSFLWESGAMSDVGPGLPVDINNQGQILLQTQVGNPEDMNACFLLQGQTLTDLGVPQGWQCHATDLNDAGLVVGSLSQAGGGLSVTRAFLWSAGTFTDLGSLGGDVTLAMRVNERGQVVGAAMTPSGYEHAFLWEAGAMTDLGTPGAPWSRATAINDRGQVLVQSGAHVHVWEAGVMRDLGTMGAPDTPAQVTIPLDLNERGQILVAVEDAQTHLFRYGIWSAGRLMPLPSLGSGRPSAVRLNERGQAVGSDRPDDESPWHLALFTTVVARGNRAR